jgi:hypothetical protein
MASPRTPARSSKRKAEENEALPPGTLKLFRTPKHNGATAGDESNNNTTKIIKVSIMNPETMRHVIINNLILTGRHLSPQSLIHIIKNTHNKKTNIYTYECEIKIFKSEIKGFENLPTQTSTYIEFHPVLIELLKKLTLINEKNYVNYIDQLRKAYNILKYNEVLKINFNTDIDIIGECNVLKRAHIIKNLIPFETQIYNGNINEYEFTYQDEKDIGVLKKTEKAVEVETVKPPAASYVPSVDSANDPFAGNHVRDFKWSNGGKRKKTMKSKHSKKHNNKHSKTQHHKRIKKHTKKH